MGWGCYKHEWDAGSDNWMAAIRALCKRKLKESVPRTWGRDLQICPACYEELESRMKQLEAETALAADAKGRP